MRTLIRIYVLGAMIVVAINLLHMRYATSHELQKVRDNGQWQNTDPDTKEWYQNLMRPDWPTSSCCGEADAYWCDNVHVRNGKTSCVITDDRDDEPLKRSHVPVGTIIEVPDQKLKWDKGNPTGHAIVFLGGSGNYRQVFCFVQSTGI
jgi:hypothetical protein